MEHAIDWRGEISTIAGPFEGNRKGWLARAARRAGVKYRQVRALYYGESANPRYDTAQSIIEAAREARINEARRDAAKLADIYSRYADALAAPGSDLDRAQVDEFIAAARVMGGRNRS